MSKLSLNPLHFFLFSILVPPDITLKLSSLNFPIFRLYLLVILPLCLYKYFYIKRSLVDFLILAYVVWGTVALYYNHGFSEWQFAGVLFVETVTPFLLARIYIKESQDFEKLIKVYFLTLVIILPFAIYETITGNHIIRNIARGFVGMGEMVGRPARLNLERAYGPFEHPIHYGFYYSALFGMILSLRGAAIDKALRMTTIIVGVFCSLSSGPLLSLVLQLVMKVWDISTRWLKYRWKILSLLAILLYLFIDLFSNRTPFHVLVSYATLRTASAFNRIHIWNWGTASVENNPVFGIGLNEWERAPWMSSSMDNFWLLTAVRYGLPALICLALAIFTLCCQLSRASNLSNQDQAYRRGWAISVTAVIIAGCTVHFWNSLYCLFFVILGSSAWINHAHRAVPRNSVTKPNMSILPELDNPQKSIVTYTRFTDVKKRRPNNSKESLPPHHSNSRDESKRYNS